MSITIDFFFNYSKEKNILIKDLETWMGCSFSPYQNDPDDLFCRFIGMEFEFCEHVLENDGDLDFKNFRYEIGTRTPIPDADFRPIQLMTMASLTYAMYKRLSIDGILVFDVQSLLARYENRNDGLFDHVSEKIVQYPDHLLDLIKRLPAGSLGASWEESTIGLKKQGRKIDIEKA